MTRRSTPRTRTEASVRGVRILKRRVAAASARCRLIGDDGSDPHDALAARRRP